MYQWQHCIGLHCAPTEEDTNEDTWDCQLLTCLSGPLCTHLFTPKKVWFKFYFWGEKNAQIIFVINRLEFNGTSDYPSLNQTTTKINWKIDFKCLRLVHWCFSPKLKRSFIFGRFRKKNCWKICSVRDDLDIIQWRGEKKIGLQCLTEIFIGISTFPLSDFQSKKSDVTFEPISFNKNERLQMYCTILK